ncbi:MAG: LptF/LptG family permease [Elusimicrobiota bacterium]
MRIFTRYVAARFLGPFLFGLGLFALLVFLGDLFDKLNRIITSPASAGVIARYLFLQAPTWAVRVVPMATLLAVLFSVSAMARSGEFVAVLAAGVPAKSFFRPLLWLSLAVAGLAFAAQETLLPACFRGAQRLWKEQVNPEWEWDKFEDVVMTVSPDRLVSATQFVVKEGVMKRPVLDDYSGHGLLRQLDAAEARWDASKGGWVFLKGVERAFDARGGVLRETPFESLDTDLNVPPKALRPTHQKPDEMSLAETWRFVRHLRSVGQPTHRARTALHAKLAYPFTNLILCSLAVPLALRLRGSSKAVAFGAALGVGFVYLWAMQMGQTLGETGRVPPVLAAWMANLAFGAAGLLSYRKIEL